MVVGNNWRVIWVAGGRDYNDRREIEEKLGLYAGHRVLLVTGAAPGTDLLAERVWRDWQFPYVGVPARWRIEGRSAGPKRNEAIASSFMGLLQPDGLLAFPGGRGTRNAIEQAEVYGIPLL